MLSFFDYLWFMENILLNGLINLAELARLVYPEKNTSTAANTLRAKINKAGFNKLTDDEKNRIFGVINDMHIKMMESF